MMEWVLEHYYSDLFQQQIISERAILVMDAGESSLLDMMNEFVERYPQLKLFSLPKLDKRRTIELGMKGELAQVELAMQEICQRISQMGYEWQGIAVSE
jgi:molybdopterin-biosynthesis enzyme MoeA-like protein